MRKILAVMAALALVAGPVAAQGHHGARADSVRGVGAMHGQAGMMQGQSGWMQGAGMMQMMGGQAGMMGMGMGPGMILRLRESLDLTEDQVAQIETLRDSAQAAAQRHMLQGMQGMDAASELVTSDSPDLDAYATRLRQAMNQMALARVAVARAGLEARDALTPEQQDRLSLARQMMQDLRPGTMGGGMMGGGMMHGGVMHQRGAGNGSG